jgi:hypothetical protein
MRRLILICALALGVVAPLATAASFYYPKRAYFRVSVSGTQTTTVKVTTSRCTDENGDESTRTASATETLRFTTRKPGRVLFKTAPHGGMIVFQEDDSFEDGVRPARARGTVSHSIGLDSQAGTRAPDCGSGGPASGCGTKPFSGWSVSLFGRGRRLKVGLDSPGPAGGKLFPKCPLRFEPSAVLPRVRPAPVSQSAVYSKRRKLVTSGTVTRTSKLVDDFGNSKGTVTTKLKFKVRLTRDGGSGF